MDIGSAENFVNNPVAGVEKGPTKEEVATEFEKIFARKLVKEMTKDSFKMGDNSSPLGKSNTLYRRHIVDTLATEIAKQRKLGMADLVSQYSKVSNGQT